MLRRFLMDQGGATILEYVVGGVLALGILGTCVWALMKAVADEGDAATSTVGSSSWPSLTAP